MFRGNFEHTIDSKGRVSIPAKFRELLTEKYDNRLIVTWWDGCLYAYPYEEWTAMEEKISAQSKAKREVKAFKRFFVSGAEECPIDKLGRILIPLTLRNYAKLERDVVFAGQLNYFEIWSKERWEEAIRKVQENSESISDIVADLGI